MAGSQNNNTQEDVFSDELLFPDFPLETHVHRQQSPSI